MHIYYIIILYSKGFYTQQQSIKHSTVSFKQWYSGNDSINDSSVLTDHNIPTISSLIDALSFFAIFRNENP